MQFDSRYQRLSETRGRWPGRETNGQALDGTKRQREHRLELLLFLLVLLFLRDLVQLEAELAFAHALALDNDDNIENDNVDNAVVLPHANKDNTVLQSNHSIHAGGSLPSCEIFAICCCVNISIAVWAGPVVPSMGRLSINGHCLVGC